MPTRLSMRRTAAIGDSRVETWGAIHPWTSRTTWTGEVPPLVKVTVPSVATGTVDRLATTAPDTQLTSELGEPATAR